MLHKPLLFCRKRTLHCWLVAGAVAWLLLAGAPPASGIDRAIGKEKEKTLSLDTVYRNPGKPLERDSINPIFAQKYKGTLLDLTSKYAVIDSWRGKSFIPRSEVTRIKRTADAKAKVDHTAADKKVVDTKNAATTAKTALDKAVAAT